MINSILIYLPHIQAFLLHYLITKTTALQGNFAKDLFPVAALWFNRQDHAHIWSSDDVSACWILLAQCESQPAALMHMLGISSCGFFSLHSTLEQKR